MSPILVLVFPFYSSLNHYSVWGHPWSLVFESKLVPTERERKFDTHIKRDAFISPRDLIPDIWSPTNNPVCIWPLIRNQCVSTRQEMAPKSHLTPLWWLITVKFDPGTIWSQGNLIPGEFDPSEIWSQGNLTPRDNYFLTSVQGWKFL